LIGETSGIISESRCVNSIGGINLSQIYLNEFSVLFFEQWQGAKKLFWIPLTTSRNLHCFFKNKLQHTPLKQSQRERVIFKINSKNFSSMSPAVKNALKICQTCFKTLFVI